MPDTQPMGGWRWVLTPIDVHTPVAKREWDPDGHAGELACPAPDYWDPITVNLISFWRKIEEFDQISSDIHRQLAAAPGEAVRA